jgi:hypothetical protein
LGFALNFLFPKTPGGTITVEFNADLLCVMFAYVDILLPCFYACYNGGLNVLDPVMVLVCEFFLKFWLKAENLFFEIFASPVNSFMN